MGFECVLAVVVFSSSAAHLCFQSHQLVIYLLFHLRCCRCRCCCFYFICIFWIHGSCIATLEFRLSYSALITKIFDMWVCECESLYMFWLFPSFHLFEEKALPFVPSHYSPIVCIPALSACAYMRIRVCALSLSYANQKHQKYTNSSPFRYFENFG